jgi:predicted transcriptional regulator
MYKMDGLLANCKVCKIRPTGTYNPDKVCTGCETYAELRAIGDKLGEGKRLKAIEMSVEQYRDYKAKGYTDSKISEELGCTPATISNWKKKHRNIHIEVKTQSETKDIQEDFKDENERLKRELEVARKGIEDLEMKIEDECVSKKEYDKLQEKLNSEKSYEIAYHNQRSSIIELDQELENKSEQLRQAREESVKYGKENEHLWGLLKIKMEG